MEGNQAQDQDHTRIYVPIEKNVKEAFEQAVPRGFYHKVLRVLIQRFLEDYSSRGDEALMEIIQESREL